MGIGGGATKTLTLELTGRNPGLSRMLADSDAKVRAFKKSVDDSNKSFSLSGAAMKGVAIGATAIAAGLTYAIAKAAAFDKAMRNVNSLTGGSQKQFAAMEKQVISMSTKLPQSATTLAEGLYQIASSGFQGADGVKVLDAAARSASAGLTTTEVSARAITSVLNAYGLKAKDAADVSDVLFSTVNLGVISFDQLANNLGDVVGSAAAAKVSIDQVGAAIATMTLSGIQGAQATTSLNQLITGLVRPSTAMTALYKQMGYESGGAALKQKGLRGVMEDLRKSTGGNVAALLKLFPNIEAARGALALMANDGANYAKVADQITSKNARMGATQKVLDEQMKSVSAQWQLLKNKVDATAISVGVKLLPYLVKGMQGLENLGKKASDFGQALQQDTSGGVSALKGAVAAVLPILEKLGHLLETAGKQIGSDVFHAGINSFNELAQVLQHVSQFAADNEKIVMALGLAYLVHATGGVAALYAGLGKVSGAMSALKGTGAAAYDFIAGLFTPGVAGAADSVTKLGDKAKAAGSKLKAAFMGVAPALAIGGVLALAVTAWESYSKAADRAGEVTKGTTKAISAVRTGGSIEQLQKQLQDAEQFITDYENRIQSFGNKNNKIDLTTLFQVGKNYETLGMKDNLDSVQKSAYDAQLALGQLQYNTVELFKVMGKPLPDAAKWINDVQGANGVKAQTIAMGQMQQVLDQLGPALQQAGVDMTKPWDTQQMTNAYSALQKIQQSAQSAQGPTKALAEAMKVTDTAMGDASSAADKLKQALDGLTGAAIGVDEAQINWLNGLATLKKSLHDNGATIAENTQKGRDNRTEIINRVKDMQDLLVANANAGASQEQLTAKLASSRKTLIDVGVAAGVPRKAMEALLNQYNLTPALVKTLIEQSGADSTKKQLQEVADAAKNVGKQKPRPTVTAETANAQQRLDAVESRLDQIDGRHANATVNTTITTTQINVSRNIRQSVDQRLTSLPAGGTGANGGFFGVPSYADGKLPKDAMIQPGVGPYGLVQWAEPETDGEAFIPLAKGKRQRSKEILGRVADEFGLMLVQKMANGGFHYPAFRYPAFRYDPKGGPRSQQSRQYLADKASKHTEYENARYAAYEEYLDRQRLAATTAGRGEGAFSAAGSVSDVFGSLASSRDARAQAAAELKARTSRSPSDTAADYYRKPTLSLKDYMAALKQSATYQRQWNTTLRSVADKVGPDVVTALQAMGEQGEDAIRKMATGSVADMKKMAAQIQAMNFSKFFTDTANDVKGRAAFQANLAALVKAGRADLASRFEQMGYDQAAGLAATAVKSPGSTLTQLNNMLAQQEQYNDPKMGDALKLAALIQKSGGKLGVIGLSTAAGMSIGDTLGLLTSFEGTVFGKIPASAMTQIRADQSLMRAGKQPSGLAMGAIVRGSQTGYYWGEPSSGGESLIPHGLDRRRRALQLWRETGRILGAQGGGGQNFSVSPGAIHVELNFTKPGATAQEIEQVATRVVNGSMNELVRQLTTGRR